MNGRAFGSGYGAGSSIGVAGAGRSMLNLVGLRATTSGVLTYRLGACAKAGAPARGAGAPDPHRPAAVPCGSQQRRAETGEIQRSHRYQAGGSVGRGRFGVKPHETNEEAAGTVGGPHESYERPQTSSGAAALRSLKLTMTRRRSSQSASRQHPKL